MPDRWVAAEAYETFMGRWSREMARRFVGWLDCEAGRSWLDVGCGTGALTAALVALAAPSQVVACDPSEPLARLARKRFEGPGVSVMIARSGELPEHPGGFDHVVSGLVLNFLPDLPGAIREMSARTRSGGLVAAYVWDYSDGMQFLRIFWDEAVALDANARDQDEGVRFPICKPPALEALFRGAGLGDVRSEPLEIPTRFAGFSDYWAPFLGGTGPAPSFVAAQEERRRDELRRRLERRLSPPRGGAIELSARAWAVRGTVH